MIRIPCLLCRLASSYSSTMWWTPTGEEVSSHENSLENPLPRTTSPDSATAAKMEDRPPSTSFSHHASDSHGASSIENDERMVMDDDEESLPSPCYPPPPVSKTEFCSDDVVWVNVDNTYVPGVVIEADKEREVAKVVLINDCLKEKVLEKWFTDLIDFNNAERNQKLLEQSKVKYPYVQAAMEKVTEFFCMNCIAEEPISASRYLIEDPDMDEIIAGFSPQYEKIEELKWSDSDIDFEDIDDDESQSVEIQLQRAALNRQLQEEAEKLMKIIESPECEAHLRRIFMGITHSKRHSVFMSKIYRSQKELLNISGLGPFDCNNGMQMIDAINRILENVDQENTVSKCGSRTDYLFHVMVPEAIIFSLCSVHSISNNDAEELFTELSCKHV